VTPISFEEEPMPNTGERRLNLSDIILIAATRGMLGAGIGLLMAGRLSDDQRRAVGATLVLVGAVTTIPLALRVFGQQTRTTDLAA
jgi:hypothetical protein